MKSINCKENGGTSPPHTVGGNKTKRNKMKNKVLEKLKEVKEQNSEVLDLSNLQISELPNELFELSSLRSLNLTNNNITIIPEKILTLKNLQFINLQGNQITELPPYITKLKLLKSIDLRDNPINNPPIEIVARGIQVIRNFFEEKEIQGTSYLTEAKLVIVGEGGAGKTSLARKIVNPESPLPSEEATTEGIDISVFEFPIDKNREFKVNIWDFGGQEIYHATHQFFLTKRSLYVLVTDTRKEDTDFNYWLNVIEILSNNSPTIIVQNEKQDRIRELNIQAILGRFSNVKGVLRVNLANNRGLEAVINQIKHELLNLPHVGTELPSIWIDIRRRLKTLNLNYISDKEYYEICKQFGLDDKKKASFLSDYLHDLGDFLHFRDNAILKRLIILNPSWATEAIYGLIDSRRVIEQKGRFGTKDVERVWSENDYIDLHDELLELMIKFELCYKIYETNQFIIPQLLPSISPSYDWNKTDNLIFRYSYDFMPKGIITRFIVRMHRYIFKQEYVWNSGVILQRGETIAEVIEGYMLREIRIQLRGNDKKDFLAIIIDEFDRIHSHFENLHVLKLVPCNCSECLGQPEPTFYNFDHLKLRINRGKKTIECMNSFEDVSVVGLLGDVQNKEKKKLIDSIFNDMGFNISKSEEDEKE